MRNFVIFIFLQFASVLAFSYCKELSPGQYESSNSMIIPQAFTLNQWNSDIFVTNVSDSPVSVTLTFSNDEGERYSPVQVSYDSKFTATNTPLDSNGALLMPGEMGRITILDDSTRYINIGEIAWHSNECIFEAIFVKHRNVYFDSSRFESGEFVLNGGLPF